MTGQALQRARNENERPPREIGAGGTTGSAKVVPIERSAMTALGAPEPPRTARHTDTRVRDGTDGVKDAEVGRRAPRGIRLRRVAQYDAPILGPMPAHEDVFTRDGDVSAADVEDHETQSLVVHHRIPCPSAERIRSALLNPSPTDRRSHHEPP